MNIYIGIDPSKNSTGVCVLCYNGTKKENEKFYIIKPRNLKGLNKSGEPKNPLTKKEEEARSKYNKFFDYILYDDKIIDKDCNYSDGEYLKTYNMCRLVSCIESIIDNYTGDNKIYVTQEGISYGSSSRTKSVFDLAGLNYMLRTMLIKKESCIFTIAAPSEIKKFATGKGNANKDMMMDVFDILYPEFDIPKKDDVADAFFMAEYSQNKYNI